MPPLAINSSLTQSGAAGATGANGANGTAPSQSGRSGRDGGVGGDIAFLYGGMILDGDPLAYDQVVVQRSGSGGSGGTGGAGGAGRSAVADPPVVTGPPNATVTTTNYQGPGGNGGNAGNGGGGGDGTARFADLQLNLGGGGGQVSLTANGIGGAGNLGGPAGSGGGAGYYQDELYLRPTSTQEFIVNGTGAGRGGKGGSGGDAGTGWVAFDAIAITGDGVRVAITGRAQGNAGGQAQAGGSGAEGAAGGRNGRGGEAGDGGDALAESTGLSINTGGNTVSVDLQAIGGAGNRGGNGGGSGLSRSNTVTGLFQFDGQGQLDPLNSQRTVTYDYTPRGAGGNGGDGGDATARLQDADIVLGDLAETVSIRLYAAAGAGGAGGMGAPAVASSSTTSGIYTTTVIGVRAGRNGSDGADGVATAAMERTGIALGAGDDTLTLQITALGPASVIVFDANTLDGGAGMDRLAFTGPTPVVVDVAAGTLALGGGPATSTIAGFERFEGGQGNDRFVDGPGDQTYQGNLGADRFEFAPGHGRDTIRAFQAGDVIALAGFGPGLDSFAEVQAATTQTAGGARIATGTGTDVLLANFSSANLTADMFAF